MESPVTLLLVPFVIVKLLAVVDPPTVIPGPVGPVGPNVPVDTITQFKVAPSCKNVYALPGVIVATVEPDTVTVTFEVLVLAFAIEINVPSGGVGLTGKAIAYVPEVAVANT